MSYFKYDFFIAHSDINSDNYSDNYFETNLDDFSVNLFLWKSIKFIHLTNINFCFLIKNCMQITVVIFILHLFLTALHYCSHILLANLGS